MGVRSFFEKLLTTAVVAYGFFTGTYVPYAVASAYYGLKSYVSRKNKEARNMDLVQVLLPWVPLVGAPVSIIGNGASAAEELYRNK